MIFHTHKPHEILCDETFPGSNVAQLLIYSNRFLKMLIVTRPSYRTRIGNKLKTILDMEVQKYINE